MFWGVVTKFVQFLVYIIIFADVRGVKSADVRATTVM